MLPDGRILYTRWEYVDKGAVSVKCLWAMRPDGTGSSEIYGNDIALPPTLIYGRADSRRAEPVRGARHAALPAERRRHRDPARHDQEHPHRASR